MSLLVSNAKCPKIYIYWERLEVKEKVPLKRLKKSKKWLNEIACGFSFSHSLALPFVFVQSFFITSAAAVYVKDSSTLCTVVIVWYESTFQIFNAENFLWKFSSATKGKRPKKLIPSVSFPCQRSKAKILCLRWQKKKQKWVREIAIRLSNRACMMMTFFSCNFPFETLCTYQQMYVCTYIHSKEREKKLNYVLQHHVFGAKSQLSTRIEPFFLERSQCIRDLLSFASHTHKRVRSPSIPLFSFLKGDFFYQISRSIKQRSSTSLSLVTFLIDTNYDKLVEQKKQRRSQSESI